MRNFGAFSIAIGLVGLVAIMYFNFNFNVGATYEELGGLGEIVTLYTYGRTNKVILILFQLAGLSLGAISGFKKKTIGQIGFTICSFNLLILFYQS